MILDNNIVKTAFEYFCKVKECEDEDIDKIVDFDETGSKDFQVSMKEFKLIEEIIACQVSFWCLRRLRNSCASNVDSMRRILNKKISEYQKEYGEFVDYNGENIW